MRRALAASAVLAVLLVALPVRPASGAQGTTWTLTPVSCPKGWVELGRGCYDQNARNFEQVVWDVHENNATWTDPTYRVEFGYTVPATIGPNGGAVQLTVNARSITAGSGVNAQVCASSTFGFSDSDNCARANPKTAGASESGSKALSVRPASGSAGSTQTITILVGSGSIVFTYKAGPASGGSSERTHVSFALHGDRRTSATSAFAFASSGGFELTHVPGQNASAAGSDARGTASIRVIKSSAPTRVLHLRLTSARYAWPDSYTTRITLIFATTNDLPGCGLPVGSVITVVAERPRLDSTPEGKLTFTGVCGMQPRFDHPTVTITLS